MLLIQFFIWNLSKVKKSFNPLIQVYAFNNERKKRQEEMLAENSFNPLIQVYAFNWWKWIRIWDSKWCFNPLIQVYAFNNVSRRKRISSSWSFNPLIQVYAFNLVSFVLKVTVFMIGFNPLIQVYAFNHPD